MLEKMLESVRFVILASALLAIAVICIPPANAQSNSNKKVLLDTNCEADRSSRAVVFREEEQGCFHFIQNRNEYLANGNEFQSSQGDKITNKDVSDLVQTINQSASCTKLDLSLMGITPEAFESRRNTGQIGTANRIRSKKKINAIAAHLSYEQFCKLVQEEMMRYDMSTSHSLFAISIPAGTAGNQEQIEIYSTHRCPLMLPWHVKIGSKEWDTYSPLLPQKLANIADKKAPTTKFLNGEEFWKNQVWNSIDMNTGAEMLAARERSERLAKELPGYEEAARLLKIEYAETEKDKQAALIVDLKSILPSEPYRLTWQTTLEPGNDWHKLLEIYKACRTTIRQHKWLQDWSSASNDRTICISVKNWKTYDNAILDDVNMTAWHDAGLKGKPDLDLTLDRAGRFCASVLLSADEPKSIIMEIHRGIGSYWLDNEDFTVGLNEFIVVSPDGQHQKQRCSYYDAKNTPDKVSQTKAVPAKKK